VVARPDWRDSVERSLLPIAPSLQERILITVPAWHPGKLLLNPQLGWTLLVLGVAATAVVILAAVGRDAYPELYALSIARLDHLENEPAVRLPRTTRWNGLIEHLAPAGVLIFAWKSAVDLGRKTSSLGVGITVTLACGAGFLGAHLALEQYPIAFSAIVITFVIFADLRTAEVGEELRRPLFWIARMGLFERVCALALSRTWRTLAIIELVAVSFAVGGGNPVDTFVISAWLPVLVILLVATSFVIFAYFPLDAQRPSIVAVLRLTITGVCLVLPIAFLIVTEGIRIAGFAFVAGIGTPMLAASEAGVLLWLATMRIDGGIDRLAA
jgi:hypothetical protein